MPTGNPYDLKYRARIYTKINKLQE